MFRSIIELQISIIMGLWMSDYYIKTFYRYSPDGIELLTASELF